jgi:hypothetical protein
MAANSTNASALLNTTLLNATNATNAVNSSAAALNPFLNDTGNDLASLGNLAPGLLRDVQTQQKWATRFVSFEIDTSTSSLRPSWEREISAVGLSNAALAAVAILGAMFFLGSEVVRVAGYKRWLRGNARHLVGITVCIIISIAEIVTLIMVSTYVPSGLTMPAYYMQGYGWAREDCYNSTKGPKGNVIDGKLPDSVKINTTSGNTVFSSSRHGTGGNSMHYRDCQENQGVQCTMLEPCTPCEPSAGMTADVLERVIKFSK